MTSHTHSERPLDAVVVGGGVIGLTCAWRAAQRGLRVRVLERGQPGSGATGAAAGMLAPVIEADFGEEALLRLNLAAAEGYPAFVEELEGATGADVGYERVGALHVGLDRDEAAAMKRLHELHSSLGLDARWLRPSQCREMEPGLTTACAGGVDAPGEARIDPRALTAALMTAVERAGGEVVMGAEVTEALLDDERIVGVWTENGTEHHARHVVLAAGCWSGAGGWLPAEAVPPVRPVKGQIVVLRDSRGEPVCERIIRTPWVYIVPRADGRLVIGATVEERGFDTAVTAGGVLELLREAYRALPEIAELELVEVSAGLRPGSPDNAPIVGEGELAGLIVATGHYRNGVLLAAVTGDAVASILTGDRVPDGFEPFSPARFKVATTGEVAAR